MMLMVLLSTGLAAGGPSADPFAVPKVTLADGRVILAQRLQGRPRVQWAQPESQHDDATETSGPVIRTEKGLLHCRGHRFPPLADKK